MQAGAVYIFLARRKMPVYNGEKYSESGEYEVWLKSKLLGCDSVVILNLTKMTPMEIDVDNRKKVACADEGEIFFTYNFVQDKRGPTTYSVRYDQMAIAHGFVDTHNEVIDVVDKESVIPGGNAIGIYVKTDGILVLGTGEITGTDGYVPGLFQKTGGTDPGFEKRI